MLKRRPVGATLTTGGVARQVRDIRPYWARKAEQEHTYRGQVDVTSLGT
jgi:hypothetical protein